jgi:parvulin-like peptidyl-prolyl cis-trans isomerase-like protein
MRRPWARWRRAGAAALALACGALAAPALAYADSLPSGAIATVGSVAITKATFDHWLTVAERSLDTSTASTAPVPALRPPDFKACVAFHARRDRKPPKGRRPPTMAALTSLCRATYDAARDDAVPFLVTADWIQGEAADEGIVDTPAEIAKMLKQLEAAQFSSDAGLHRFLATSGETQADLAFRVRIDDLSNKLRTKAIAGPFAISADQIAAYYTAHADEFSQAERREVRLLHLRTATAARHARSLLAAGQSFANVAKRYPASGGRLVDFVRGQHESHLDAAVFGARVGRLVGPLRTASGYDVLRVQRVTPASTQTVAQATPAITAVLTQTDQQDALNSFVTAFNAKWRAITVCAAGYVVSDCSNGPSDGSTTPTGVSGDGATTPTGVSGAASTAPAAVPVAASTAPTDRRWPRGRL